KILTLNGFNGTAKVVVNQCKNIKIAKLAYNKFKETVKKYLHNVDIMLLGIVIQDQKVVEAIKAQQALISIFPDSNASKCIKYLAKNLLECRPEDLKTPGIMSFWNKCLQLIKSPLNVNVPEKKKNGIDPESPKGNLQEIPCPPPQDNKQQNVLNASIDTEKRSKSFETTSEERSQILQIIERQIPAGKIVDFTESKGSLHAEQDIPLLVSKLIDCVSSVSLELQLIRKAIEEQGKNILNINNLTDERQNGLNHNSIILDFETFMKEHGIRVEENVNK
ncbi:MAG TPA: hypothetical protein VMW42_13275, partial [Desulfatiglandales bacterium]|nr:hypothetical protein [Desulfatiglandales bacterium]